MNAAVTLEVGGRKGGVMRGFGGGRGLIGSEDIGGENEIVLFRFRVTAS